MVHVYLAGPITLGGEGTNVHNAIVVYLDLRGKGYAVYCPHLDMLAHMVEPHDAEFWMKNDLAWIERSDVVLRLPGKSVGADQEVAFARGIGIGVFSSVDELEGFYHASK